MREDVPDGVDMAEFALGDVIDNLKILKSESVCDEADGLFSDESEGSAGFG